MSTLTLCVDCGGGGIKACVIDEHGTSRAPALRTPTPYPLPPTRLANIIAELAQQLPAAERVTVGMPGMIRHGVVVYIPHYVNISGPRTRVLPELVEEWQGTDFRSLVSATLQLPALVLNDAELHAAGVIAGRGLEVVITLGTGLGCAVTDNGKLAPHMEMSHAQLKWGLTYDDFIGEHERLRLGDSHWSRRVRHVVESLRPVYWWDRLYIGGGNARRIAPAVLAKLGDDVVTIPNSAAILGGVRAWEFMAPPPQPPQHNTLADAV